MEYSDITKSNPSLGNMAGGSAADVNFIVRNPDDNIYIINFKKMAPYKDISVYHDGGKLKIFYDERWSKKLVDTWIEGVLKQGIKTDNILIYKNNELVTSGINIIVGIE